MCVQLIGRPRYQAMGSTPALLLLCACGWIGSGCLLAIAVVPWIALLLLCDWPWSGPFSLFPNRSLLLRVLMGHQRVGTQKHTQTVKRPALSAGPESQNPSHKNTKINIKQMVFNCFDFLQYSPSGNHSFVSRVRALITKHINFNCDVNMLHQFIKEHLVL